MSEHKRERFSQKLETLDDRLTFIENNFTDMDELRENRILRKAFYKEFQELVEVTGDLGAMITKDEGRIPKDDYTNIEGLKSILEPHIISNLKKANGLRNVLVHEYSGIIDQVPFESAE